jgi:hypothetical protein
MRVRFSYPAQTHEMRAVLEQSERALFGDNQPSKELSCFRHPAQENTVMTTESDISYKFDREIALQEISDAQAYLILARNNFIQHVIDIHKGIPATSCHSCLSYKQAIQSNENFITFTYGELARKS